MSSPSLDKFELPKQLDSKHKKLQVTEKISWVLGTVQALTPFPVTDKLGDFLGQVT